MPLRIADTDRPTLHINPPPNAGRVIMSGAQAHFAGAQSKDPSSITVMPHTLGGRSFLALKYEGISDIKPLTTQRASAPEESSFPSGVKPMIFSHRLRWVWLSLAIVFLDRATKAWIDSQTNEFWRYEVIRNFIYLVHSRNPGIAFSLFANSNSPILRIGLIAGAVAVIGVIAWLLVTGKNLSTLNAAGLALLLGGATGNVTDRILHGAVTDFIEVFLGSYRWPAFNVADSAITIGAILLILDVLFTRQHRSSSN